MEKETVKLTYAESNTIWKKGSWILREAVPCYV